jgi:tetratricopeptide (TPR) repeat protein
MLLLCAFSASPAAQAHGDLHEQIENVTARIKADPGNAELYFRRAELYRQHEEWPAAAADYDHAEKLAPRSDGVHLGRAKLLQAMARYDAALAELDRFLADWPDNVDGLVTRARVHEQLGQHLLASEDFAQAIRQADNPEPEFYLERAKALAAANPGHSESAVACLDEGIARLGPLPTLGLAATELEVEQGRFDDALSRLERLSAGEQRQEAWLERRGDILVMAGRREQARQAYSAAQLAIASLPPKLQNTGAMQQLRERLAQKLAQPAN